MYNNIYREEIEDNLSYNLSYNNNSYHIKYKC